MNLSFEDPHVRLNLLTNELVLVSPHRNKRPWQGKVEDIDSTHRLPYEPHCYLCPGNKRADGEVNPAYADNFSFTNDFSAILPDRPERSFNEQGLLQAKGVRGVCKVISFSPRHDLTLPELDIDAIENVVKLWIKEFKSLESMSEMIKYIQIFENKGDIMGCSNPHPHGQIWAQSNLPNEIEKETVTQRLYFGQRGKSLLSDYLALELKKDERVVFENEHFAVLVPFWAVWPFETMIISKRQVQKITEFTKEEQRAFADALKRLTTRYDNLFNSSFPYSAGMHQAPVNYGDHPGWHWHMHFYPPLLRSASIKKFMVGYELLASPQRDITPEAAAATLKTISEIHYKENE